MFFSNLLGNALKFTGDGGRVTVRGGVEGSKVWIEVEDTGVGIDPEQLDAIYDPFVTSKTRGAGLGLTMVYQIVMNHHGEIKINSETGNGTEVTIQLPLPTDA